MTETEGFRAQNVRDNNCGCGEYIALVDGPVAVPATVEEMHARLDGILEACALLQELVRDHLPVTQREVAKLRRAFWLAAGEAERLRDSPEEGGTGEKEPCGGAPADGGETMCASRAAWQWDTKAAECNEALRELEKHVELKPVALTNDVDRAGTKTNQSWIAGALQGFINIPFERRIQTFVVSLFTFFTFIPIAFWLTLLLLRNWWTMPLMTVYIVYMFTAGRPKHPLKKRSFFVQLRLWRYYGDYFPVRLIIPKRVRQKFSASKNYFFIYHPHGIHGFGAIAKFCFDATLRSLLPGVTVHMQTLRINFFFPFWREFAIICGAGDASAECISRTLRSGPGESVMLVVGGAQESMLARPNTNELLLRSRKGFVRIALEEGVSLVPVYAFGETDVYRVYDVTRSERWKRLEKMFRKVTSVAFPLFTGRGWFNYGFGLLPHRRPIFVVVGEPIRVPKIAQPTPADVQEWHNKYVEALTELFSKYRGVYGVDSGGLYMR